MKSFPDAPSPSDQPRILYVFTVAYSVSFILDMIPRMIAAGFDVAVISSAGAELNHAAALGASTFSIEMERSPSPLRDIRSLTRLYRIVRRMRPDVTNVGTPKAGLLGGLAALLARVPQRIYTVHGLRLETTRGVRRFVLWLMEWLACRCATQVHCVSVSLMNRLIALRLSSRQRTRVLGKGSCSGIDLALYEQSESSIQQAAELRNRLGIREDALVVGFVGRLVRDKGITELYEAFCRAAETCSSLVLLLVGPFEERDPVPLETRLKLKTDARVILAGWQWNVIPYYQIMDLFAFPSYREGLGQVLLQAQASGLPVIACRIIGVVDAVAEGKTAILTRAGDVAALANSLNTLLSNSEMRSSFGAAGRLWVREHFSSERVWEHVHAEYRRLLEER